MEHFLLGFRQSTLALEGVIGIPDGWLPRLGEALPDARAVLPLWTHFFLPRDDTREARSPGSCAGRPSAVFGRRKRGAPVSAARYPQTLAFASESKIGV